VLVQKATFLELMEFLASVTVPRPSLYVLLLSSAFRFGGSAIHR